MSGHAVRPCTARRVEVERGGVRAGWHSETPYVWRVCCSAGVTAGMASLAACSTLRRRLFESMEERGDQRRKGGHAGPYLHGTALGYVEGGG
jgi:hypothetical protein